MTTALAQGLAFGWTRDGHRMIAAIAAQNLKPAAAAEVKALLDEGETLESVASWADEVRGSRPESSTWHYINIHVKVSRTPGSRGEWKQYCPPTGCVASAIDEMTLKLKDRRLGRQQRAEALKFLMHFISDMHQPLHSGDMDDRGGNGVAVIYKDRATNLHSLWDLALLRDWLAARPAEKARLERGPGFWARREMRKGTLDDWLWQAHAQAGEAYRRLPAARPAPIGQAYVEVAGPILVRQLERAGVRLARVLNETLAG